MAVMDAMGIGTRPATADFNRWLRNLYRRAAIIVPAVCAAVSWLFGAYTVASRSVDGHGFRIALFAFQMLVCMVLLFLIPKPRTDQSISRRAAAATEQFIEAWEKLWLCWVLLYLVFCARETCAVVAPSAAESPFWSCGLNLANNLQTMVLVMVYLVISKSTVDTNRSNSKLPWTRGIALLALASVLHLLATVAAVYVPATSTLRPIVDFAVKCIPWASAIASGLAMALVVGRLDSKFADPPTWAVTLLYLYALIQVLWERFGQDPVVETVVISAALMLKCLLFLIVAWMLQSGVLFFYLDRLAYLITNVESERTEYLRKLWRPGPPGGVRTDEGVR
jgi:hypothetical protein